MESFQSVEDDLHVLVDSSAASSYASSSSSSFTLTEDGAFDAGRFRKKTNTDGVRCSFCEILYQRLDFPFDTCTPECALTFCVDSAHNFNATYANLLSRFSGRTKYYPCPIPNRARPADNESPEEYGARCTLLCYGEGGCKEKTVRQHALEFALSSDMTRK
jgi:hypothetical protein